MTTPEHQQQNRTNQDINTVLRNKDVRIDDVRIVSIDGLDISIIEYFASIEIYENLFLNNITGRISLIDGSNLPTELPLTGQEILIFTFSTPGTEPITLTVSLDKISERIPVGGERSQVYDLHFISIPFIVNLTKKVSKSYTGKISEIVRRIFSSYLSGPDVDFEVPNIKTETTFGSHKFVIPNWRPQAAINWLAQRAISDTHPDRANYIFYEDLGGFKFVSLTSLMNGPIREVYESIVTRKEHDTEDDYESTHRNIQSPIIVRGFDRSKEIPKGIFSSSLMTHDIVKKTWDTASYNYTQEFDSSKSLNNWPILPVSSDYFARHADSKQYFSPKHAGIYGGVRIASTKEGEQVNFLEYPDNSRQELWMLTHDSLINQLKSSRIEFDIFGDSNRRVGDRVQVIVPPMKALGFNNASEVDTLISGTYLITKIRHRISLGGHEMRIELSKDSFIERMPDFIQYEPEGIHS